MQLLQKTVGQPIASLGQWITNWVAGENLITNRTRLAQELYAGLRTELAPLDFNATEQRSTQRESEQEER